jgi:O-Antigen ligase.
MVILWKPLQLSYLQIDGAGRSLILMTIVVFLMNINDVIFRRISFHKPAIFWVIWCLFSAFNLYMKGYHNHDIPLFNYIVINLIMPCVVMQVTSCEYIKNKVLLVRNMLVTFLIYALIGGFILPIGYIAYQNDLDFTGTLGNLLGLNLVFIIYFAGLLLSYGKLNIKFFYFFVVFALVMLVVSATRKALVAAAIIFMFIFISYLKLNARSLIRVVAVTLLLCFATSYVMKHTYMGERIKMIENTSTKYNTENNLFLKFVGDRAEFYRNGMKIFFDHPFTGVGVGNYRIITQTRYVLHTEYMVQLAEHGAIGFILFACFYVSIIRGILKRKHDDDFKKEGIVLLGGILAILFICFTAWIYNLCFYFVALGTMVGYLNNKYFIKKVKENDD